MTNRGQAALEFMTTYGWAFMVILVMIGALASFGVLDPSKFLPQRCQFGELNCENFALDSDADTSATTNTSVIYFQLLNGMAESMTVTSIGWRDANNPTWTACEFSNFSSPAGGGGTINNGGATTPRTLSRDGIADFICSADSNAADLINFEEGKREKIEVRFEYNIGPVADTRYSKYLYGEISANAR